MHEGSCQCGSVHYEFDGEPLTCYACHCTDCQTGSGSAFSLSMIVHRDNVNVIKGELVEDTFHLNGHDVIRHRCNNCSTALWYSGKEMPQYIALKPGTFDDTSWYRPIAHVWTRSAQPWVVFDSNTSKFEKQPEISELLELWQESKNVK